MMKSIFMLPFVLAAASVPNPNGSGRYPHVVDLVSNYENISGYTGNPEITISTRSGGIGGSFRFGYTYIATRCAGKVEEDVLTLHSVTFREFSLPDLRYSEASYPYFFSPVVTSSNAMQVFEGGAYFFATEVVNVTGYSWVSTDSYYPSASNSYNFSFAISSFSGSALTLTLPSTEAEYLCQCMEPYFINYFTNVGNYEDGYAVGLDYGHDTGYDEGYEVGYHAGYDAAGGDSQSINDLFGALMSVPVAALNALTPFVVWDTPIVSIIFSFLVFGLTLWAIKRFI